MSETSSLESSRRSSRSQSPAPRRTPPPTLRIKPMAASDKKSKYPTWYRVLTSGWFYYPSLVLTLLLIITLSHYHLSIDYCTGQEYIDCKPCPKNYKCTKTEKSCDDGKGYDHNDVCIPEKLLEVYDNTKNLLEELVKNGTVKTIEQVRNHPDLHFEEQPSQNIVSFVSIIDGYTVKGGKIVKEISESYRKSIVLSVFIISFICFLVSLYLRNKPPQF